MAHLQLDEDRKGPRLIYLGTRNGAEVYSGDRGDRNGLATINWKANPAFGRGPQFKELCSFYASLEERSARKTEMNTAYHGVGVSFDPIGHDEWQQFDAPLEDMLGEEPAVLHHRRFRSFERMVDALTPYGTFKLIYVDGKTPIFSMIIDSYTADETLCETLAEFMEQTLAHPATKKELIACVKRIGMYDW